TFKLPAIDHEIAIWKRHLPGHLGAQILYGTDQIAPGNVGRDDDTSSHVLSHDDVRSPVLPDIGEEAQWQEFALIDIDGQRFDGLDIVACLVRQPQHHVETLLAIENLRDDFAIHGHLDILGDLSHHDPILGGSLAIEAHVQLRNQHLLFGLQVDDAWHGGGDAFDLSGFAPRSEERRV